MACPQFGQKRISIFSGCPQLLQNTGRAVVGAAGRGRPHSRQNRASIERSSYPQPEHSLKAGKSGGPKTGPVSDGAQVSSGVGSSGESTGGVKTISGISGGETEVTGT